MADIDTTISPNLPKGKVGATETGSPKSLKKRVPKPEETVTSNGLDDAQSQVETDGEQEDGQTEKAEEVTASGEEGEEAEEAVPVGSVDAEGNVVDGEGKTVGKVNGDAPEGSMVDTEGDVLDAEGNVIGKAKLVEHAAKDMEEGAGEAAGGADPVKNAAKNVEEGAAEVAERAELVEHAAKDLEEAAGATAEEAENPEPAGPFRVQGNGEATNEGDLSEKGLVRSLLAIVCLSQALTPVTEREGPQRCRAGSTVRSLNLEGKEGQQAGQDCRRRGVFHIIPNTNLSLSLLFGHFCVMQEYGTFQYLFLI